MDAPYHFFSSMNHALKPGGEPSWRIDDVPLDWCYQPGVKLDFRHLPDGYVATPGDVEAELKRIGHELRPLEIVLVNTAAGARYGEDDFVDRGCGVGKAAHAVAGGTRRAGRRHGRLELGCAVLVHPRAGEGRRAMSA